MNRTLEIEVRKVLKKVGKKTETEMEAGPMLSRRCRDGVQWTAPRDESFTICFNHSEGSPFKARCFPVTFAKPADSGPVLATTDIGDYHYEILPGTEWKSNNSKCQVGAGTKSPKVRIKP
jgi:hypothetical protein